MTAKNLTRLKLILGLLVTTLGSVVIVGWFLYIPLFIQLHPNFALMVFNTALGFMLSGAASLLLLFNQRRFAFVTSSMVLLIGSLALWQYLTGQNLQVDELFMQQFVLAADAYPGRMSFPTALCFILTAMNLILHCLPLSSKTKIVLSGLLAPAIIALPFTSVLSYLFNFEIPYGWGNLAGMALHTSLGFIVLGAGFILWSLNEPTRINAIPSVAIALFVLLLALWAAMGTQTTLVVKEKAELRNQQIMTAWIEQAKVESAALLRKANRLNHYNTDSDWDYEASLYMHDFDHITFSYIEVESNQVFTTSNSNSALLDEVMSAFGGKPCTTRTEPSIAILDPSQYSGNLLVKLMPTKKGCLIVSKDFLRELNKARQAVTPDRYPLVVYYNDKPIYEETSSGSWFVETTLSYQDLNLRLQLTPKQEQLAPNTLSKVITVSGLGISVMLLLSLYAAGAAIQKSKESRQLLIALRQQEATSNQVIEMAPNAMIMVDKNGLIELVNAQAEKIFGYTRVELFGKSIDILLPKRYRSQHPQHRESYLKNPSSRAMGTGRDLFACRKDDSEIPVEIGLAPISSSAGIKILASIVDISERKYNEKKQTDFVNELARINEELNNFAYIASHDLKSPLRGIDQLATWITEDLGDSLSTETQAYLRLMRSRIKRMEMLLDDLLAYSRVGRTQDEIIEVDTHILLEDIFDLIATKKNIALILSNQLPVLKTKKVPLELVFRNLISNAIKHHDKAQGSITVSSKEVDVGIEYTVQDDGPGIPKEHQVRVFAMFQTLRPRDEVEGSGIGLALVKKAVESMGGNITLESDGHSGCAFKFTWPTMVMKESES